MSEKPYEDIDLEVDEEKFHALVAKDEKAYQDFKDSPMGKLLLSNLDGKGKDGKGERDAAPFFSDPVLYAVLASGKHDGRSIKGRVRALLTAVGLTEADD